MGFLRLKSLKINYIRIFLHFYERSFTKKSHFYELIPSCNHTPDKSYTAN